MNELGRRGPYCIAPTPVDIRRVHVPALPLDGCEQLDPKAGVQIPLNISLRALEGP